MKTNQEALDQIVRGIVLQGGPAIDGDGVEVTCMYRAPNGRRCAAGQLIPDHLYDWRMEGASLRRDNWAGKVLAKLGYNLSFIQAVQKAHDQVALVHRFTDAVFLRAFAEEIRSIAYANQLTVPPEAEVP